MQIGCFRWFFPTLPFLVQWSLRLRMWNIIFGSRWFDFIQREKWIPINVLKHYTSKLNLLFYLDSISIVGLIFIVGSETFSQIKKTAIWQKISAIRLILFVFQKELPSEKLFRSRYTYQSWLITKLLQQHAESFITKQLMTYHRKEFNFIRNIFFISVYIIHVTNFSTFNFSLKFFSADEFEK